MDSQVISVKEFVAILNDTLVFAFPSVMLEGEVSGYKVSQGKWVFFDLKDDEATISCFMPIYQLKVPLEDGMRVRVGGSPKLTNWGKFSFTARTVELAGEGELRRAFELLKAKLSGEGLFASERKRALPLYPKRIGLITSGTSAAYADFTKILSARWGGLDVLLADVAVQGASAPDLLVGAVRYFDELAIPPDVVVMIRGGGSLEDLQAFNTEAVARAVAASRAPIVVGVGHEVDTSLADLAADVRAATPTDAARLVVRDRSEVAAALDGHYRRMDTVLDRSLAANAAQLERALAVLTRFLARPAEQLARLEQGLLAWQSRRLSETRSRLQLLERVLASYDPRAVLGRGYAIVRRGGEVVRDPADVPSGAPLMIELAKGNLEVTNR